MQTCRTARYADVVQPLPLFTGLMLGLKSIRNIVPKPCDTSSVNVHDRSDAPIYPHLDDGKRLGDRKPAGSILQHSPILNNHEQRRQSSEMMSHSAYAAMFAATMNISLHQAERLCRFHPRPLD